MRPSIGDDQRRARLQLRQFPAPGPRPADSPVALAGTLAGFHATTSSTVHLSAWARDPRVRPGDLESALYDDRALVKQLAMRRTLFVLTRPLLAAAVGAIGARVAASERTNMLRELRRSPVSGTEAAVPDPEGWIAAASEAVLATLAAESLTTAQLRAALPEYDLSVDVHPGKTYGGAAPMLPRLLNHLSARGDIVRGDGAGSWNTARNTWTTMTSWLGTELPHATPDDGHAELVRCWLRTYGPGTEEDLVWWLGSTKTAVRRALSAVDAVEVALDSGDVGYLLPDDLDDVEPGPPRALLLPELDPTTMGYKKRDFYLGPHAAEIFDATGNGGQTAWWDGRIVGGWIRRPESSSVEVLLLEDVPAPARRALDLRAEELAAWLGEEKLVTGYPSPQTRRHR
ncbi:winged helix DNA-binding domain-containing protein [Gordonia sp. (in: high G+C Gram-positive bacteria)]|uniref:winged helix DNA-binding domain-containing protein n=1 Tax=Gordonia sp. (in: high G+C Gram-positive bacteria) TaxID=84139 RepID=UPI003527E2B0